MEPAREVATLQSEVTHQPMISVREEHKKMGRVLALLCRLTQAPDSRHQTRMVEKATFLFLQRKT